FLVPTRGAPDGQAGTPPPEPLPEVLVFARGNNQLALDMLRTLPDPTGNLVFSPYSISTSLAMTTVGSGGETQGEILDSLHYPDPPAAVPAAAGGLMQAVDSGEGEASTMVTANALWPDTAFPLSPSFQAIIAQRLRGMAEPVDFRWDPNGARTRINQWVSDITQGKIPELLEPGTVDSQTALVLTNAVYFKGKWQDPFDKGNEVQGTFHRAGQEVPVAFMNRTGTYPTGTGPGFRVAALPYAGGRQSMVLMVPNEVDGLSMLERRLAAPEGLELLDSTLEALQPAELTLQLPGFRLSTGLSLKDTLQALGIRRAFDPATADLRPMLDPARSAGIPQLYLGAVEHKATIEVDEEGTVATAATGQVVQLTSVRQEPVLFRADRPFLALVRDDATGAILFVARVTDPTQGPS
ncbi:MAG TPA: serpin family protein, partial [bacterium]|nr:serpin family protein [bacterium]